MTFWPPEVLAKKPLKGFVCVVNADYRGVKEIKGVARIWVEKADDDELMLVVSDEDGAVLVRYRLRDVWGAWLEWPELYYTAHHREQHRRGPEYFLELTWHPWEWTGKRGEDLHWHGTVPFKNSIWCDDSNTDIDPMIATVRGYGPHGAHLIGWARKNRASQRRVESFHYPDMP